MEDNVAPKETWIIIDVNNVSCGRRVPEDDDADNIECHGAQEQECGQVAADAECSVHDQDGKVQASVVENAGSQELLVLLRGDNGGGDNVLQVKQFLDICIRPSLPT